MRILLTSMMIGLVASLYAQSFGDRYRTPVFDSVTVTTGVLFSENVPQPTPGGGPLEFLTGLPLNADDTETTDVDLFMDIYQPAGDTISRRPAVVVCFGGGFLTGSRDYWSIVLLADSLAQAGFVVASIDYRLGFNVYDQDLAQRSVYRAIQDSRAAVKFLRANADTYRIDTNEVYIGGHSAGAFMALHNLYLDKESERPLSTFEWSQNGQPIPDLGTLDATGIATGVSGQANSAFSLAGALGFLSFIEDTTDQDGSVLFHSQDDDTVPYDTGEPFGSISGFIFGSDLPTVYGSLRIDLRGDTVSLPDSLYSYSNRGHGVHEIPPDQLHDDIIPAIGQWFYEQRLKPEVYPLEGPASICDIALEQTYSIEQGDAVYFEWAVQGGAFDTCSACSSITVQWSDTASTRSVSVTPYNEFQARGATQTIEIDIVEGEVNSWTGQSGSWFEITNWSLGRIPLPCDDVVINGQGAPLTIDIQQGSTIEINSLNTSGDVEIILMPDSVLEVKE